MTEPDFIWRQSDLAMFNNCPRSFMLQRLLGHARPRSQAEGENREPGTADVGTLVHYLLQCYYGGYLEPETDVYPYLHRKAAEIGAVPYSFVGEVPLFSKDWVQTISMAATMYQGYVQWVADTGDDLTLEVLALEHTVQHDFEVGGRIVRVTGQLDMLVRDTGEKGIIDHKSRDSSKWKGPRPGDFQLHTYAVLEHLMSGEAPAFGSHNMLKRSRRTARASPPFFDRQPIRFSPEAIEQHHETMLSLLKRMVRLASVEQEVLITRHHTRAHANLTSGDCSWACPVKEVCDVMHQPHWKEFADEHYPVRIEEEGADHYDRDE